MKIAIRIAVGIATDGQWTSSGWNNATEAQMLEVVNMRQPGSSVTFVTAEIEQPEIKTVPANIEPK